MDIKMIKDFKIEGFRHFESVELRNLRRVNLFVGKNSAGKSALLEALILFFSQMSSKHLPKIHSNRQEDWEQGTIDSGANQLRHLFKNHQLPLPGVSELRISSKGDERSFSLMIDKILLPQDHVNQSLPLLRGLESYSNEKTQDYPLSYEKAVLVMIQEHRTKMLCDVLEYPPRRPGLAYRSFVPAGIPVNYVPTSGITNVELASMWDTISLTEAEGEVIKGLQLIEPNVEAVAFVGRSNARTALVKLTTDIEPVTLKSLGDGMSRVLQIIVSLVNSKGGVLIIDEFENGLHWSVQAEVWELVFKLSARLGVQVFATTHSRDCIFGFEEAWSDEPEAGAFARLQKINGSVKISEYSFPMLRDSLETDVEVR